MKAGSLSGKLIVFSAPSGTGKSTIARRVLERVDNLTFSVSATTRPMRPGEVDGVHYFFLDRRDFQERVRQGGFIEYEYFFGNYYGTLVDTTLEALAGGRNLLFDLDVKGALNLKRFFRTDALLVFIKPPDMQTLRERLVNRDGTRQSDLHERLGRAELELAYAGRFDVVVFNDALDRVVDEVTEIVTKFLANT